MTGEQRDRIWSLAWTALVEQTATPADWGEARRALIDAARAVTSSDAEALHRRLFGAARDEEDGHGR